MTPIRWGILGAARIARALIPAIRQAGGEVVALGVRDPQSETAMAFAQQWDVPLVGHYEQVLEQDLDAVYNPLPNHLHLPWTLATLRAGKHALTEKPFVLNADEAAQIAQVSQETGRLVLEAFAPRFHPYLLRLREIALSGELGALNSIHSAFGFSLDNPQDFRWHAAMGGGALFDVGTYCVNMTRLILGEPQAVSARARWTAPNSDGVDLGLSGILEYEGVLSSFDCAFDWAGPATQCVHVMGREGSVRTNLVSGSINESPLHLHIQTRKGERSEEFVPFNAYAAMVGHFQRAIRGEELLLYGPQDALAQARVLDALYQAARSGDSVALR